MSNLPHSPQGTGLRPKVLQAAALAFLALLLCLAPPHAVQASPPLRAVLVCEGSHSDFYDLLVNIARELKALNIISHAPRAGTVKDGNTEELWRWLSAHAGGTRLAFLADGFYSAGWDHDKYATVRDALRARLAQRRDVDLILAFGTWAGQEMARLRTSVPVIVCGATDALSAGIVKSATDSGKDNVVAVLEPDRILRQIELFHQIFAFRKLGVTYTDTPSGRSCAGIDEIVKACARHSVELVHCTGDFFHVSDTTQIAEQMTACHKKFAEQHVDAVFITYNSLPALKLPKVLEPLNRAHIPTISQVGPREVRMGVLAGIASYCKDEGRFTAHLLRDLLQGSSPRSLPQQFNSPLLLAINVQTAARIGWSPSLEHLMSVDDFFP